MRKKETISGIASILIGNGGAGLLAWFGQTIPALVLSAIFTIGGIILLIVAFRIKGKGDKSLAVLGNTLKIGAKVKEVHAYGYYDEAEGSGGKVGDWEITVAVILSPTKPTTLSTLSLVLWRQGFDSQTGIQVVETTTTLLLVFGHVPKELAVDTKDARIRALSTDGSECFSEPFPISFEAKENGRTL